MKTDIKLTVNGEPYELSIEPHRSLLDVLREDLGLIGAKKGCDEGECGACTVLLNSRSIRSCIYLAVKADGKNITTIEGLANDGKPHPIQKVFVEKGGLQCGFCTPGMILSTKELLDNNPNPGEKEIRDWLSGNLCRCTGYVQIVEAVSSLRKGK